MKVNWKEAFQTHISTNDSLELESLKSGIFSLISIILLLKRLIILLQFRALGMCGSYCSAFSYLTEIHM